jgi:hypothetical protein
MLKKILLIGILLTNNINIVAAEKTCYSCYEDLTKADFFDPKIDSKKKSHFLCTGNALEKHNSEICNTCMAKRMLMDPEKSCPQCKAPGKLLIQKKINEDDPLDVQTEGAVNCLVTPNKSEAITLIFDPFEEGSLDTLDISTLEACCSSPLGLLLNKNTVSRKLTQRWAMVAQKDPNLLALIIDSNQVAAESGRSFQNNYLKVIHKHGGKLKNLINLFTAFEKDCKALALLKPTIGLKPTCSFNELPGSITENPDFITSCSIYAKLRSQYKNKGFLQITGIPCMKIYSEGLSTKTPLKISPPKDGFISLKFNPEEEEEEEEEEVEEEKVVIVVAGFPIQ